MGVQRNLPIYMVFILSYGFSIPYRRLARVGFEPTTPCLPCTRNVVIKESTCIGVTPAQVFSCEYSEIFKNSFL